MDPSFFAKFAFYHDDHEAAFILGHIQIRRDFREIFLRWYCTLNLNFLTGKQGLVELGCVAQWREDLNIGDRKSVV